MPKEHRVSVFCVQILLMCLAMLASFVYFLARPPIFDFANPTVITVIVSLGMALLLETVAYESISEQQAKPCEAPPEQTIFAEAFSKQAKSSETIPEQPSFAEAFSRQAKSSEGKSDPIVLELDRQNLPTPQAKRLHEALNKRGIYNEVEFDDGYKHTDISIPWARVNIEIDGKYHLMEPEHLFRDLERDSYSHLDGMDTIRIPNSYIDNYLDQIADSIAEVARKRQERGYQQRDTRRSRRIGY